MNLREPFIEKDLRRIQDFIASIAFATFINVGENNEPMASHLPVDFVPSEGKYGTLIAHIANANPHVNFLTQRHTLLVIFMGTDAYISPSWFASRTSAPTQAHKVVHCYGIPRVIRDVEGVRAIMERQVRSREKGRPAQWHISELGEEGYLRRLKAISGLEMPIDRMLASFRLLQDEDMHNVQGAINELNKAGNTAMTSQIVQANADRK